MGSSPSIAQLQKKQKAFDDWLTQKQTTLEAKENSLKTAQNEKATGFYSENSWTDAKAIATGSHTDFQQMADFTLKNLKGIIDAVGSALFSGGAAPDGATVDPDGATKAVAAAKEMGTEAADATSMELYIAGKVFDILSSVVMSFGTSTKLNFSTTFKSEPLGFGMQLFCTTAASSIQSSDFFNDEYIFQYLYIYDVRFSLEQAKSEGQMDMVKQYANAIAGFEVRLNDLDAQVAAGKLTGEQYKDQSKIWQHLIAKHEKQLQAMKAEASVARELISSVK